MQWFGFSECAKRVTTLYAVQGERAVGQMTVARMARGCCPRLSPLLTVRGVDGAFVCFAMNCNNILDEILGVVEHLPLDDEKNVQFLKAHTSRRSHFHFTAVREPSEQFVSFYTMMRDFG